MKVVLRVFGWALLPFAAVSYNYLERLKLSFLLTGTTRQCQNAIIITIPLVEGILGHCSEAIRLLITNPLVMFLDSTTCIPYWHACLDSSVSEGDVAREMCRLCQ